MGLTLQKLRAPYQETQRILKNPQGITNQGVRPNRQALMSIDWGLIFLMCNIVASCR